MYINNLTLYVNKKNVGNIKYHLECEYSPTQTTPWSIKVS